jgi:hypothetical protein
MVNDLQALTGGSEEDERRHPPQPGMSRDEFARWVGRYHYSIDRGIREVYYLPENAPDQEVRLLEVNDLLPLPENAPVEPVDFLVDLEGIPYTLRVADVTPWQLDAIRRRELSLPGGWEWKGSGLIPAGQVGQARRSSTPSSPE